MKKVQRKTKAGVVVEVLGQPFRVWERPPGLTWSACLYPDGVLRPVPTEELEQIGENRG